MGALIEMKHVSKVFPPNVLALHDVSVDFEEGEIHAMVGENGAGKSTLMKILYGLHPVTSGEIFHQGIPAHYHNPGQAIAKGIGMVHQEILLIPQYTIWENVVLGMEPIKLWGVIDKKKARAEVQARVDEFHFNLDINAKIEDISVAARQKVEILKLLYRKVSVLILDEPTSVLTPQEIPQLFDELRNLRDNGHTIIFISHHLEEVMALSDRITVLRKGNKIGTVYAKDTNKAELAKMMVGREVVFSQVRQSHKTGEMVFEAQDLTWVDAEKRTRLSGCSFNVNAGEIVGIAGVEGNGQHELVNSIMGQIPLTRGAVRVDGEDITTKPVIEKRKKIAFVSQDRANMGASLPASITENTMMTHHRLSKRFQQWGGLLLDFAKAGQFMEEVRKKFAIQMDSRDDPISALSGGNQQKVILGRELLLDAPFLLLDQPTRGLDVGSIEYVHEQILENSRNGRAILLLSADLDELFRLSDRILVMHRGKIVADLITDDTNIDEVGLLMLEGKPDA